MVPCGTLILPYLYLGDQSDASDPERLKCHNIYYVLNVTADLPGEGENHSIHYKRIPARDSFDQNLVQYFEESFKFIGKFQIFSIFNCDHLLHSKNKLNC